MSHTIFIALGTNLGDRLENLRRARLVLAPEATIVAESPIYETPPWGYLDQPAFLNQVVEAQTELSPQELIVHLKRLEAILGRSPGAPNGPRLIDLDLLFYDELRLETPTLTIPHPRMVGRGFVLLPMADLAPDLRHPGFGTTIAEMLQECELQGIVPYA
jgi:2-amino-4-hydroxy-6-hydroxymethyldihydropteridine diphosphokinase